MTVVREQLAAGRSVDEDSFADITASPVEIAWGAEGLEVSFTDVLTASQERAVRRRLIAASPAEEALLEELSDLALQEPTTTAARLLRLESAVSALTRLVARGAS